MLIFCSIGHSDSDVAMFPDLVNYFNEFYHNW